MEGVQCTEQGLEANCPWVGKKFGLGGEGSHAEKRGSFFKNVFFISILFDTGPQLGQNFFRGTDNFRRNFLPPRFTFKFFLTENL